MLFMETTAPVDVELVVPVDDNYYMPTFDGTCV